MKCFTGSWHREYRRVLSNSGRWHHYHCYVVQCHSLLLRMRRAVTLYKELVSFSLHPTHVTCTPYMSYMYMSQHTCHMSHRTIHVIHVHVTPYMSHHTCHTCTCTCHIIHVIHVRTCIHVTCHTIHVTCHMSHSPLCKAFCSCSTRREESFFCASL